MIKLPILSEYTQEVKTLSCLILSVTFKWNLLSSSEMWWSLECIPLDMSYFQYANCLISSNTKKMISDKLWPALAPNWLA